MPNSQILRKKKEKKGSKLNFVNRNSGTKKKITQKG